MTDPHQDPSDASRPSLAQLRELGERDELSPLQRVALGHMENQLREDRSETEGENA